MRRFLLLLPILLVATLAHAQATLTSVNMAISPASPTAAVGQPWTATITVTDPSSGSPVTGSIWIDRVTKTADSSVPYCTTPATGCTPSTPAQVALSSSGQGTVTYALGLPGSYTVNIDYQQTPASGILVHPNAFVVSITNSAPTTPTTTTSPSSSSSTSSQTVTIPNPIACNDATCLISQVIRYILGVIAVLATLMFIWGGVMMLTSAGNADRVKRAKETLAWASIGIVVILLSWGIIRFVLAGLLNASGK